MSQTFQVCGNAVNVVLLLFNFKAKLSSVGATNLKQGMPIPFFKFFFVLFFVCQTVRHCSYFGILHYAIIRFQVLVLSKKQGKEQRLGSREHGYIGGMGGIGRYI